MQKNWYILYTKPKCEKKVSHLLTKRKIENFCPQTQREVEHFRRSRIVSEVLFESYVFVKTEEESLKQMLHMENVINIVYWKSAPAVVSEEEIDSVKKLIESYSKVTVQRTRVNSSETATVIDKPSYTYDGNVVMVRNKGIKVNLPSIGFTIHAVTDSQSRISWEGIKNKEFLLQ